MRSGSQWTGDITQMIVRVCLQTNRVNDLLFSSCLSVAFDVLIISHKPGSGRPGPQARRPRREVSMIVFASGRPPCGCWCHFALKSFTVKL